MSVNIYSSPYRRKIESRRLRLVGNVKCMVGMAKAYTILDVKLGGK
jgi:hypothetical protein